MVFVGFNSVPSCASTKAGYHIWLFGVCISTYNGVIAKVGGCPKNCYPKRTLGKVCVIAAVGGSLSEDYYHVAALRWPNGELRERVSDCIQNGAIAVGDMQPDGSRYTSYEGVSKLTGVGVQLIEIGDGRRGQGQAEGRGVTATKMTALYGAHIVGFGRICCLWNLLVDVSSKIPSTYDVLGGREVCFGGISDYGGCLLPNGRAIRLPARMKGAKERFQRYAFRERLLDGVARRCNSHALHGNPYCSSVGRVGSNVVTVVGNYRVELDRRLAGNYLYDAKVFDYDLRDGRDDVIRTEDWQLRAATQGELSLRVSCLLLAVVVGMANRSIARFNRGLGPYGHFADGCQVIVFYDSDQGGRPHRGDVRSGVCDTPLIIHITHYSGVIAPIPGADRSRLLDLITNAMATIVST